MHEGYYEMEKDCNNLKAKTSANEKKVAEYDSYLDYYKGCRRKEKKK